MYYLKNIGENEDILSYPKVLIKKGDIHGKSRLFPPGFSQDFSDTTRFTRSRGAQLEHMNHFFKT